MGGSFANGLYIGDPVIYTNRKVGIGGLNTIDIAILLCVLTPYVMSIMRVESGQAPASDRAITEIYVTYAGEGQLTHGAYSRYGWWHPGPALYYLLALGHIIAGTKSSVATDAGAVCINLCFALLFLFSLRSCAAGHVPYRCGAIVLLSIVMYLGIDALRSPWNPLMAIHSIVLFLLGASLFAAGIRNQFWPTVLVASFLVQTHVGYVVLVAMVLSFSVLMHVAVVRYGKTTCAMHWRSGGSWNHAVWFPVAALIWLPVLVGEIRGYSNIRTLYDFFTAVVPGRHPVDTLETIWHRWSAVGMYIVGLRDSEIPSRLHSIVQLQGKFEWFVPLTVTAIGFSGTALYTARTGRFVISAMCAVAVVSILAIVISVHRIPGDVYEFLLVWISIVGAWSWIPVIWSVSILLRAYGSVCWGDRRVIGIIGIVVSLVFVGHISNQRNRVVTVNANSDVVRELLADFDIENNEKFGRMPFVVQVEEIDDWHVAAGFVLALLRSGHQVKVDNSWAFMYGRHIAATGNEGYIVRLAKRNRPDTETADDRWKVLASTSTVIVEGRTLSPHEEFYGVGWGHREEWGRFALGRRAVLRLPVHTRGDTLQVEVATFPTMDGIQTMRIVYDQELQYEAVIGGGPWQWQTIEVPIGSVNAGVEWRNLEITFQFARRWIAGNTDLRLLALPVKRVTTRARVQYEYDTMRDAR